MLNPVARPWLGRLFVTAFVLIVGSLPVVALAAGGTQSIFGYELRAEVEYRVNGFSPVVLEVVDEVVTDVVVDSVVDLVDTDVDVVEAYEPVTTSTTVVDRVEPVVTAPVVTAPAATTTTTVVTSTTTTVVDVACVEDIGCLSAAVRSHVGSELGLSFAGSCSSLECRSLTLVATELADVSDLPCDGAAACSSSTVFGEMFTSVNVLFDDVVEVQRWLPNATPAGQSSWSAWGSQNL